MRDPSPYYTEFENGLASQNMALAEKFRIVSQNGQPRQVFMWLYSLRASGQLPKELEKKLEEFWDLFC
jgi:hypothetical protein